MSIGMGIAIAGIALSICIIIATSVYVNYLENLRIYGKKEFINE